MENIRKRVSLDHSQILNEGAALRQGSALRKSSDNSTAFSSVLDDADEPLLAPRGAKSSSFSNPNQKTLPSSSHNVRMPSDDQNLEKTLANIKTMSLMFESGALSTTVRPNSLNSAEPLTSSVSRAVVVPAAPPLRNSSRALRDRSADDNFLSNNYEHQPSVNTNISQSAIENSYVRGLEHRVEQLESMLEAMQHRLGSVLATHESTKIPSKHEPASTQGVQFYTGNNRNSTQKSKVELDESVSDSHGQDVSGANAMSEIHQPKNASGPQRKGRRYSMHGVAHGIIFARRIHLPAIGLMPTFDKAACSAGIVLHNMNSVATLMEFSNTPHPFCLGPIITRGTSMLSIALYFGEPALPTISESISSAHLQSILNSGSMEEIAHAIISSPPDVLKSLKVETLANSSKQFGVRFDKKDRIRCERDLRRSCREFAKDAANVGVCYFGICGANVPSHGIRGHEMVWCSSINERKEPGALKMKPLMGKDDKVAALKVHIKLLLSDLASICDAVPGCGSFLSDFIPRRRSDAEDNSRPLWSNLWNDAGGQKQVSSQSLYF